MSNTLQRPKGTQDIVGESVVQWQFIEQVAKDVLGRACYQEIRTPVFEYTELFKRGVGEDTDIVNKEMYTFEKGDRHLTLRPEGTASVVRSFIEQGMSRWPKPVKFYYVGPMFRYERPQAGRQRQFHQLGLEAFGVKSPALDAEVIYLAMVFLETIGLPELTLEINNIGDAVARQGFRETFRRQVQPQFDQLCETCQRRYETNPFRMLDCKNSTCQAIYQSESITALLHSEWTSTESQAHFQQLMTLLDELGIDYRRNVRLVRGLDYYTDTVFEITSTHLGAQNAVCGGGRYDGLVKQLGGEETPGVGWAMGLERLIQLLPTQPSVSLDYYIVTDQWAKAFHLATTLRAQGHQVEVDTTGKNFGKQLTQADKRGATHAIIVGVTEVESQCYTVKNLKTGQQETKLLADFGRVNQISRG